MLLGLVLVLFVIARIIGGRGPGHIGRFKRAASRTEGSRVSSSNTVEAVDAAPRRERAEPGGRVSSTENVSAWFGEHKVLHRVNLEMQANQVTSLIGPSGCGKSTFLRILNRMHELVPSASLVGHGPHRRHRHLPLGPR